MTSPLHLAPTERDRERFRDMTKAMGLRLEYARFGRNRNEDYRDAITEMAWRIWWAQERERQLLQNLNQSQAAEISRLKQELEKKK